MKKILFILVFIFFITLICSAEPKNKKTDSEAGKILTFNVGDGVKFDMVYCPAGTFTMGCTDEKYISEYYNKFFFVREFMGSLFVGKKFEPLVKYNEKPHKVTLTKPFYIGKYEVTQELYEYIMGEGENLSKFKGSNNPVESVSYESIVLGRDNDCMKTVFIHNAYGIVASMTDTVVASATPGFLNKLNSMLASQLPEGYKFDLPTEAQWEYACKAGTEKSFVNNIDEVAWHKGNSGGTTHEVGQKKPNAWGIYDMHGNVLEMCRDYYGFYSGEDEIDPKGKNSGSRICRGGCFNSYAACCRSSTRNRTYQSNNDGFPSLGFRLALVWAGDTEKYKPVHYENKGGRLSISVPDEIIFDD